LRDGAPHCVRLEPKSTKESKKPGLKVLELSYGASDIVDSFGFNGGLLDIVICQPYILVVNYQLQDETLDHSFHLQYDRSEAVASESIHNLQRHVETERNCLVNRLPCDTEENSELTVKDGCF